MCEAELKQFNTLKKFDNFLKVFSFYHVERCCHKDYSQCYFAINLRYMFIEDVNQEKQSLKPLKNYCRIRKLQLMCSRLFIHHLTSMEKKLLELEKNFKNTLKISNNSETEMKAPLPNLLPPEANT